MLMLGDTVELNIIEDEPKSMIIEFMDSDRAVAELIKDKLMGNASVEYAGVVKEHPDIGHPRLVVKSSKSARSLVLKALEEVQDDIKDLTSQLPKQKK